jgi:hypothetical protein
MWSGIRNILEKTWKYATPFDRMIGITLVTIIIVAIFLGIKGDDLFIDHRATWIVICLILYAVALIPPVKRMTDQRHELVFYVASWGLVSLVVWLVAFYVLFFILIPDQTARNQWDRVLNVPPILGALFGATIGWYVHQQLNAKLHRTSNSFALIMQTRTNTEFLKYTRSLYAVYPPPDEFPAEDLMFLKAHKRAELDKFTLEIQIGAEIDPQKKRSYLHELSKVEAIEGLKYLLNFYEFMAQGVHAGDLDETLLYETISPSVVGWYSRCQAYCNQVRSAPSNKLAYQHLHKLVEGHVMKVGTKEIEVHGWKRKLEIEKANTP